MDIVKLLKLVGELVFKSKFGTVTLSYYPGESNIPSIHPFAIDEEFEAGGDRHSVYKEAEFVAELKATLDRHDRNEELDCYDMSAAERLAMQEEPLGPHHGGYLANVDPDQA